MFIYEKEGKLNIMFQSTQIPATDEADVVVWKDEETGKVYAKIGENTIEGQLKRYSMFLYEKNGKLNFQFGSGQLPTPTPTLELDKRTENWFYYHS